MTMRSLRAAASAVALALVVPVTGFAQQGVEQDFAASATQGQAATQPAESPAQLSALLAPIALYPDPLLTNILAASTYPLEVVEADRWLGQPGNAGLSGDQLAAALQQKDWDPSVKSLAPFPQILKMMDDRLDWTQQLGNAFLAQQADVMDTVQVLRRQSQAAGMLNSTPQQVVSTQADAVEIEPANPQQVSVPAYDPNVVYGTWPYPDVPPMAVEPYYPGYADFAFDDGWFFGPPVFIDTGFWFWGGCDWHDHHLWVDGDRFNRFGGRNSRFANNFNGNVHGVWQHDPGHRRGVGYQNAALQQRYQPNRIGSLNRAPGPGPAHSGPVHPGLPAASMNQRPVPGSGTRPFQPQPAASRPPVAAPHPVPSSQYHLPAQPYSPASSYRMPNTYQPYRQSQPHPPVVQSHYAPAPSYRQYAPPARSSAPPASYRQSGQSYASPRSFASSTPSHFSAPSGGAHFSAPSGGTHFSAPSGGASHGGWHR